MAISIITFTADSSGVTLKLTSDNTLDTAELILNDGTVIDILSSILPTGNPDEYNAFYGGDFSDGIIVFSCTNVIESFIISIGNLLLGNQLLLKLVLQEIYDCVLFQQLEACRQLILGNVGSTAQDIYKDVQNQAASCADDAMLNFSIYGTNIWIEDSKYIIK